jgi:hypothetical protein
MEIHPLFRSVQPSQSETLAPKPQATPLVQVKYLKLI